MRTELAMFETCHGLAWLLEVQQQQELLGAAPSPRGVLGQGAELSFCSTLTICQCGAQPSSNQMVYEVLTYAGL